MAGLERLVPDMPPPRDGRRAARQGQRRGPNQAAG
uniref:Uncharacterized protein n=1 Tax=Arundo donax TaxID=35708 RepID=A0A0A8Y2R0_ARUDO